MIRLEADYHGFPCPHCNKTLSVESWDTEYNDPQVGKSRVYCPICCKPFDIEVDIRVIINPIKTNV